MSQPSRTDPPSSTDAMRPTSFIGATSTSYEEVNAEDDCYQGDYNVGIEADDDGVLNPTKKDVMRESQNNKQHPVRTVSTQCQWVQLQYHEVQWILRLLVATAMKLPKR